MSAMPHDAFHTHVNALFTTGCYSRHDVVGSSKCLSSRLPFQREMAGQPRRLEASSSGPRRSFGSAYDNAAKVDYACMTSRHLRCLCLVQPKSGPVGTFPSVAGEHSLLLHLFLQLSRNEYHDIQTTDQSCQRLASNKPIANGRCQPCRTNGPQRHHRCLSRLVVWARRRPPATARGYSRLEHVLLPA